jgi:hypothetical protein
MLCIRQEDSEESGESVHGDEVCPGFLDSYFDASVVLEVPVAPFDHVATPVHGIVEAAARLGIFPRCRRAAG